MEPVTTELNKFYGVLTDGDNTVRKTTKSRQNTTSDVDKLLKALFPAELSKAGVRALAELYIRLIETHKQMSQKLDKYDPLNSYKLHSFAETFTDTGILPQIVTGIKTLGLADEEESFLPLDYILNALDRLLDELNGE